jgi:uncharacterized protein (TIGR00369 family)
MTLPVSGQSAFGVTPVNVIAPMTGLEFLQTMFAGKLPSPPIMEWVGIDEATAEYGRVVLKTTPAFRHYNPIGSVHGGYAATLLDSVMALSIHSMLPAYTSYTTLEFKVSFIKGMSQDTGQVRSEGKVLNVGRRAATAEGWIYDSKDRLLAHGTTTCLVLDMPKPPTG